MSERTIEIWLPRVAAVLAAVAGWVVLRRCGWSFGEGQTHFMLGGVTFGAILAGFVTTNFSIVVSLESKVMDRMRDSDYYPLFINYLQEVLWSAIALATLGLLALFFVKWLPQGGGAHLFGALWLGLLVWTLGCFIRACLVSVELFKAPKKSPKSTDGKDKADN